MPASGLAQAASFRLSARHGQEKHFKTEWFARGIKIPLAAAPVAMTAKVVIASEAKQSRA
jgi:hypothetical protein